MTNEINAFLYLDAVMDFRASLNDETDRGCALMAAAFLDEELKKLLLAVLVDDEKVAEELFSYNGPLGTFSSRINLAYMLGLIGSKAHRDIHLIRKIRNEFGHTPKPIQFSDPKISSRCQEFYHRTAEDSRPPRSFFTNVTLAVLAIIHASLIKAKHADPSPNFVFSEEFKNKNRALVETIINELKDEA